MARTNHRSKNILFLKLKNTGGTTFSASILFPYCKRHHLSFMTPYRWWALHPRLIKGTHFNMAFRHFPDFPQPWAKHWISHALGDYMSITILRDPLERAISRYNHLCFYKQQMSFEEYLSEYHEQNHQSRWLGFDGRDDHFVEQSFSAVGLTSRFNESMLLFRHILGLQLEDVLYISQNTIPKKIQLSDLNKDAVGVLKKKDWLDIALYEQGSEYFNKKLGEYPKIKSELLIYQRALRNFTDTLWDKRGSFSIGFSEDNIWSIYSNDTKKVNVLSQVKSFSHDYLHYWNRVE